MPVTHKRLDVTRAELAILKQAVESFNDMHNDMMFDELTTSLFPRGDNVTTINAEQAKVLRKELADKFDYIFIIRNLLYKVGGNVNEAGYAA